MTHLLASSSTPPSSPSLAATPPAAFLWALLLWGTLLTGGAQAQTSGTAQARWITLGKAAAPSLLQFPRNCTPGCPLVVISHPRAQDAARLRDSARVGQISQALLAANFAVLLSGDGGVNTWGSPAALREVAQVHKEATRRFRWNGRTYALGISMGGLLALRSALPDSPYRVSGVALLDAWVSLRSAWGSAQTRRGEIAAAYGLTGAPGPALDPLPLALRSAPLPLFVVASAQDKVVPAKLNAEPLFTHAEQGVSRFVQVTGPHLGGNRFTPALIRDMVAFFQQLEGRARAWQNKEFPGLSLPGSTPAEVAERLRRQPSRSA